MTLTHAFTDTMAVRQYLRELGPLPEPKIQRAHDVRHIVVCAHCRRLADNRHCVRRGSSPYHGRCFIRHFGMRALIAVPSLERAGLQLGDIGLLAARALLEADEDGGRQ